MDIEVKIKHKKYAVISYAMIGDRPIKNYIGKFLFCKVVDTPMEAIAEFKARIEGIRWDKPLIDCMAAYNRDPDNVRRDMLLYTEDNGKDVLCRVAIIFAEE